MSTMAVKTMLVSSAILGFVPVADAKGFLKTNQAVERQLRAASLDAEVEQAMGAALGCGGPVDQEKMANINKALLPMWNTLPKNSKGRIDQRSLRYMAHRYFMQRSNLQVRGFEPAKAVNSSHAGHAEILSKRVPAFVETMLEGPRAALGFSLDDAVMMVATLNQLIYDSEAHTLEKVFRHHDNEYTAEQLLPILENYMVSWMMAEDEESVAFLLNNRSLLEHSFPHWSKISEFALGQAKAMDFKRKQQPTSKTASKAMKGTYTFEDTHELVAGITENFASFWESECTSMKDQLVEMDADGNGRVPLAKFYGSALEAEWRFGESENYLRELGALDETSSWKGKQVIIPNYINAASNCIVSTPHYLVCCTNDCEGILGDIEIAIGAASASPEQILGVVANITVETSDLSERGPLKLKGTLTTQLEQIASAHGGKVPLHGRLFSQWLHYVFPQECPFPHKQGVASFASPQEFGDDYIASKDEMHKHAAATVHADSVDFAKLQAAEEDEMSQWDHEEELFADYTGHLSAPWEIKAMRAKAFPVIGLLLLAVVAIGMTTQGGFAGISIGAKPGSKGVDLLPTHGSWGMAGGKAHLV
eukprot:gnl/TRDRNA2_/TRDRNA2_175390_c0_seq5.p1 gnl/TRDRNA2_/TRDRNA2_175390_c0~~gnl/TRDRNA2_/TRDRNA2_175390_c0_seq5.p1  ORF type:complete len:592 (+),score=153.61 gnl/TRDRNA2_/TRDRNA2_175390_c0_seq5:108-1883(+)